MTENASSINTSVKQDGNGNYKLLRILLGTPGWGSWPNVQLRSDSGVMGSSPVLVRVQCGVHLGSSPLLYPPPNMCSL